MTNQINNYSEELAKFAAEATAALPSAGGEFIGTSDGRLTYKGAAIPNNQLDAVILDFTRVNLLYDGAYDPDNPAAPICYAFGTDANTMAPHADSAKPQCKLCKDCPMNQFGSAEKGKGKACQNTARVALVPAGAIDTIVTEEVAFMKVPVMSVANLSGYAQQLAQTLKRPPFAVVTRIGTVPDPKSRFRITFEVVEQIDGEAIGAIMEKRKNVKIDFPFAAFVPPPPKPTPSTTSRFSGARRS